MDEERFQNSCFKRKEEMGGIHQPFYSTWVADFMRRQDAGTFMLGKCLGFKKIPWKRRRRLGMVVADIKSTASQPTKIGKMQSHA